MSLDPHPITFGLILMGAFFSLTREYLTKLYLHLYGWLKKTKPDARLERGVQAYFMLTGMLFTIIGLLGLLGIIPFGE